MLIRQECKQVRQDRFEPKIDVTVFYFRENSHTYCKVIWEYISNLVMPQYKREKPGRFYS